MFGWSTPAVRDRVTGVAVRSIHRGAGWTEGDGGAALSSGDERRRDSRRARGHATIGELGGRCMWLCASVCHCHSPNCGTH